MGSQVVDTYELSPTQAGMLFHAVSASDSGVYVEQVVATLREPLDEAHFVRAWQRVVERHSVLRSRVRWEGIAEPVQDVIEGVQIPVERLDWRTLTEAERHHRFQAFLNHDRARGFDLGEAPLVRLALVRAGEREHWVLWTFHHIMLDGVSRFLLWREVFAFYEAFSRGEDAELPLPRPYRDHIEWLRKLDQGAAKPYWRSALSGFRVSTPLVVAHDRESEHVTGTDHRAHELRLSGTLTTALRDRARQASVTLNTLLQGAWALLLNRHNGVPDIVFGATRACRKSTLGGADDMVGLFINTLPIRVRIDPEADLVPWLQQLRAQQVVLRGYEHTPLLKVQGWSDVPRGTPLFESILVFDNQTLDAQLRALGGAWRERHFQCLGQTNYPLTVVAYGDRELFLRLNSSGRRFADDSVARMLGDLHTLLKEMAAHQQTKLGDLLALNQRGDRAGDVSAFLAELYNRNIYVRADGDQLRVDAPAGVLTPELSDQLRQRKSEIQEFLRGPAELSFNQQQLWFLDQLEPGGAVYAIAGALEVRGALDLSALERALGALVGRHEALRTVFVDHEGHPLQVVSEPGPWTLPMEDLSGKPDKAQRLWKRLREEVSRGFDLARGPLFRAQLYRLAPDTHVLLLAMHHIISDGWSMGVLMRELGELYGGFSRGEPAALPVLRVQYRDFARWQRGWLQGEVLHGLLAYWRSRLAGAPQVLELPADRPRPPVESHRGAFYSFTLPPELVEALRGLSRRDGATLFMTLVSGFALLLSRYSGQQDLLIGTPVANRNRAEIEDLVGFFVNTLVLRADLSGDLSVRQHLVRMREVCLDALAHQDLPFDRLVEELRPARDLSRNPLFQVMFVLQNAPQNALELPGLKLQPVEVGYEVAKVDLTLEIQEKPEGLFGVFGYATDLFDKPTIARMATHWRRLLEAMVATPERRVSELSLLTEAERHQLLVEWNDTDTDYPADALIHELFEAQAARTPEAVAVVFEDQSLTYRELDGRSNQLARYLQDCGVGPDTLVALCVERSLEMVVGVLGILKAGSAYVPLDPSYPAERLAFMLQDTQAPVLLTQARLLSRLPIHGATILCLDTDWHTLEHLSTDSPPNITRPTHLAYVIYTSGSTGRPKGACITHRGLVNYLSWAISAYKVAGGTGAPVHSSIAFDLTITSLFTPLLVGRTVELLPDDQGVEALAGVLRTATGYSLVKLTPAHLQLLQLQLPVNQVAERTRWFVIGGEQLQAEAIAFWRRHAPQSVLVNEYGPTETVVGCCVYTVTPETRDDGTIPIGRPIANTQLYILDRHMEPVPIGVAGELYIGGDGVARGYWNRPQLTAERFVPNPFTGAPTDKLYRTGDLARFQPDGNIECLGRIDHQVKIRGYRIELGEIEAGIATHSAIREVVVLAREDVPGDKRLVAYVVAENAPADLVDQLRAHLRATLPDYMVPSAFVALDQLPLTPNGKVDRKALPAPDGAAYATRGYEAPVGEIEATLAQIWAEVLELERVGRHDHFFELGGHSLLAIQVVSRMRRAGLHAEVRALFVTPTLAALAAAVGGESGVVEVPANRVPRACKAITPEMLPLVQLKPEEIERVVAAVPGGAANIQDIYPLAPLQEGILFHHLMASKGDPYLLHVLLGFDSRARLGSYLQALQAVIERHDILRTAVLWEGLPEPVQVVWRRAPLIVEEVSLDAAGGDIAQQLGARFDPRHYRLDVREAPLLRVFIARDAANARWVMLQLFQHLSIDHTTAEVMQQEIQAYLLGQAGRLPAPLPFRNFVAQTRLGVSREEHEAFFKTLLGDVDEPTAPFGLTDVQGDGSGIEEVRRPVDAPLAKRLRARARALGVSTASVCHLAWAQVLARVSGRNDVVFGTVLLGRMQGGQGAERVLGLFINTLPVRIRISDETVQDSVRNTHTQLAQLLHHEHAPLALAQRCSAVAAPAPLFSALLNYRHSAAATQAPAEALQAWEGVEFLGGEERTNYPLVLSVDDLGEGFALTAQVQSPLHPARICAYMHAALEQLVGALESAPATPVRSLDVLTAAERHQLLVEWNDTDTDYPADALIHELFEAQAARTPEAVAVVFEDQSLTYRELDRRANQLAHRLQEHGVGADTLVALCVERSLEMVVGLLGILKAGGAYVPIDPDLPPQRMAYMLEEMQSPVALIQHRLRARLPWDHTRTICLDTDWSAIARKSASPASSPVTASNIAYVIYTSGSTGRPKGVMVPHTAICNHMYWMQRAHPLDQADAVLQKTPFGFDASVWEFYAPLLSGARLVIARPGGHLDPAYLVEAILGHRVSILQLVPSQLRMLLQEPTFWRCAPPLKRVFCGGEPLTKDLCDEFYRRLAQAKLHNLYGPTEATIDSTSWECPREGTPAVIPIGKPIDNARTYIVSPQMQLSPVGVPGELLISGAGLARGYLNRPELTAENFIPDPFRTQPGTRVYKTGDLARFQPDGNIECLGRIDHQVKIRGYRIELGEIEAGIATHSAIREVVVLAREDVPGDKRLVAYVVAENAPADLVDQLRAHLRATLPDYMVPSAFVALDQLPLTPNGKVDRKALPAAQRSASDEATYVAPRTPTEETLAGIWGEVLGLERVGINDNYFELGGHSLTATRIISRLRTALGINLPLREIFERPTLAGLAEVIDRLPSLGAPGYGTGTREEIEL